MQGSAPRSLFLSGEVFEGSVIAGACCLTIFFANLIYFILAAHDIAGFVPFCIVLHKGFFNTSAII